jgi:hypothetical protein
MKTKDKQELLYEADRIKRDLKSGKISGKKHIKAAKYKMYNLRYRANKVKAEKEVVVKKSQKIEKVKAKKVNPGQGFLPGFLPQMNMVRVEELVADKLFKAIKSGDMTALFSSTAQITPAKKAV